MINNKLAHIDAISDGGNATEVHDQVGEEHAEVHAKIRLEGDLSYIVGPYEDAKENLGRDDEQ